MTAKIKLNAASGGGSFSLQAPSSSSNNRVFTIPDVADGTIATTATAGKILQVKQTILTSTASRATSSNDFGNIGLDSPSFTPSSGTKNLIMVVANISSGNTTGRFGIRVVRNVGGTETIVPNSIGDADGSRQRVAAAYRQNSSADFAPLNIIIEDTHGLNGSTSVNYRLQTSGESSDTIYLNRSNSNSDSNTYYLTISTITVMEFTS